MSQDDDFFAVVLSIVPARPIRQFWPIMTACPEDIFRSIAAAGPMQTVPCVADVYGPDPRVAADRILAAAAGAGAHISHPWRDDYPPLLREIARPPIALYVMGSLPERQCVAMVGTRGSDIRSDSLAKRIAGDLARNDIIVVSGLALGIDRASHIGALEAGGFTAGIMANGIDIRYPRANRDLYDMIISTGRGAIITEYPPGIHADKWTFARRNRIISGMARALIVVKAGMKSGALITAKYAVEQNRDVYACGGFPYDGGYEGCQRLIQGGANILISGADLVEGSFPGTQENPRTARNEEPKIPPNGREGSAESESHRRDDTMTAAENAVMAQLAKGDMDVDTLTALTGLSAAETAGAVIALEIRGLAVRRGNRVGLSM